MFARRFSSAVDSRLPARRSPRHGGYTLLGLSVLLFAVAVALALGIPVFQHSQRIARARATVADLRKFDAAFQRFAREHGDWPPAVGAPGAIPAGLESALAGTRWTAVTPLGGRYVWLVDTVQRGQRFRAAIGIVTVGAEHVSQDRRDLDALLSSAQSEPGDAHQLRLGYRNEPVYVLEQ